MFLYVFPLSLCSKESNNQPLITITKCITSNRCHRIGNCDACETCTTPEQRTVNTCHRIRNSDACKSSAVFKCTTSNTGHRIWYSDTSPTSPALPKLSNQLYPGYGIHWRSSFLRKKGRSRAISQERPNCLSIMIVGVMNQPTM